MGLVAFLTVGWLMAQITDWDELRPVEPRVKPKTSSSSSTKKKPRRPQQVLGNDSEDVPEEIGQPMGVLTRAPREYYYLGHQDASFVRIGGLSESRQIQRGASYQTSGYELTVQAGHRVFEGSVMGVEWSFMGQFRTTPTNDVREGPREPWFYYLWAPTGSQGGWYGQVRAALPVLGEATASRNVLGVWQAQGIIGFDAGGEPWHWGADVGFHMVPERRLKSGWTTYLYSARQIWRFSAFLENRGSSWVLGGFFRLFVIGAQNITDGVQVTQWGAGSAGQLTGYLRWDFNPNFYLGGQISGEVIPYRFQERIGASTTIVQDAGASGQLFVGFGF